ncbi:hypothetical protein [Ornithinimicrobium cerasi]|nr:hypothetical protein [Ornithinimicrobium cerasi]
MQPELVPLTDLKAPEAYKRLSDLDDKAAFRAMLRQSLTRSLQEAELSRPNREELTGQLDALLRQLESDGLVMLGGVVSEIQFREFVARYEKMMAVKGNNTFIHNFVDVRSEARILLDETVNESFCHPLLIAIVAYAVGGPVRMVDVRAKDAEPISVLAQDNMLHIDNTPFNDEYKILLTWEKGTTRGPNGQNFTYLPGTHRLARQCEVDDRRGVWSSENCSIFTTADSLEKLLQAQSDLLEIDEPAVIEVAGFPLPVSTVFPAGSLAHHRFRTATGQSRSCVIAAFHRVADNPGSLRDPGEPTTSTLSSLLAHESTRQQQEFISALARDVDRISELLSRICEGETAKLHEHGLETMSATRLDVWRASVLDAPPVRDIRAARVSSFPLPNASGPELCRALVERLMFDKHGPIDLILYADNHEEVRKWARNSLRETSEEGVAAVVACYSDEMSGLSARDVLQASALSDSMSEISGYLDGPHRSGEELVALQPTAHDVGLLTATASLRQLAIDLAEAILRVDSRDSFRSTSAFAMLTSDAIRRLVGPSNRVDTLSVEIFRHYACLALAD